MASGSPPAFVDMETRRQEIEESGYTIFPAFLDRSTTADIRAHIDRIAGPVGASEKDRSDLRHPIPGEIMPRIASNPATLQLARILLGGSPDLRMREQVLIRTDPQTPPHGPISYHIDAAFRREEFETVPRQVYYQMLHYCSTVAPGGAGVYIVPGSHKISYEIVRGPDSAAEWGALDANTSAVGKVDGGIEICADDGDLIVFNPLCFHAASPNRTGRARYVYFTSFYDASAERLIEFVRRIGYRDHFPDSLRDGLPAELRSLLEY